MKILLVDDDQAIVTIFQTALMQDKYEVVTAATGKDGIDKAKSEKPDFILLDQMLPDIQGNEVLTTLKADSETKDIPVAMLSNFGQEQMIQPAINQGALDYILKYQIAPSELGAKVETLLKEHKAQKAANTT
ncbi:MAG TPA: response regulator [Patescibacteria group bacterium]|nr:response regulator [Patescibacteria group bacterium]